MSFLLCICCSLYLNSKLYKLYIGIRRLQLSYPHVHVHTYMYTTYCTCISENNMHCNNFSCAGRYKARCKKLLQERVRFGEDFVRLKVINVHTCTCMHTVHARTLLYVNNATTVVYKSNTCSLTQCVNLILILMY